MGLRSALVWVMLAALTRPVGACEAVDFRTLDVPRGEDPVAAALVAAYPEVVAVDADWVLFADGRRVARGTVRDVTPAARLDGATVEEMFFYPYPLAFDLAARRVAWFDPGRLRSDAFFKTLYGGSEAAVRRALVSVRGPDGARFFVTERANVACQLAAVFQTLGGRDWGAAFRSVGGSFNWRVISGTDRLSSHSFGAALDLNSTLGGYWKWDGAAPGQVGDYAAPFPAALVQTFERFGFIWGGKWHHFDGMHFEYRPDLILHARILAAQGG